MNKELDTTIRTAFHYHADSVEASSELKQKIDQALMDQKMNISENERSIKKPMKWNLKKAAVIAAGICILTTGVSYAGGQVAIYMSGSSPVDASTEYNDITAAGEKAGIDISAVESFSNGFTFEKVNVFGTSAYSEEYQKLYDFDEVSISYVNEDMTQVSVYMSDVKYAGDIKVSDTVRECDGITISYFVDTYKFVPVGYELTEEDLANMEADNYFISEGSEEVEVKQFSYVTWVKDGVFYHMFGYDLPLTEDDLFNMAEEMIRAE